MAKLVLPESVGGTEEEYVLHPSMIDGALQAAIGLAIGKGNTNDTSLAFMPEDLKELVIYDRCKNTMWAVVQYNENNKAGDKEEKFDIDICDEEGKICVRMKEFTQNREERELRSKERNTINKEEPQSSGDEIEAHANTIILTPVWDAIPREKLRTIETQTNQTIVIIGGTEDNRTTIQKHNPKTNVLEIKSQDTIDEIAEKLKTYNKIDHIFWISPNKPLKSVTDNEIIEDQDKGVINCLRTIKAILQLGYGDKSLEWSIITYRTQTIEKEEDINPTHASIHGLVGSMAKEYPNWKIRLVDLENEEDLPIAEIFALSPDTEGNAWGYRRQTWHGQKLIPVEVSAFKLEQTIYRRKGVYVVIGGAGGIGKEWSKYMIQKYGAQIIWIGRREKDERIQADIDELRGLGNKPYYITADARDREALQKAYEEIKEEYKQINGVIHSAIVLLDKSLMNMEEERFKAGLSAKVDVSVNTAHVFGKENLDFMMFFSSMNSFTKAAGQSNYSSGCTFTDSFAHQLSRELRCKVKIMNWGYWGSVGTVSGKEYQDRMRKAGIGSIEPPEAMEALEILLSGPIDQIALMKTTVIREIESKITTIKQQEHNKNVKAKLSYKGPVVTDKMIEDHIKDTIIEKVSESLKINIKAIDDNKSFSDYGVDSILGVNLIRIINQTLRIKLETIALFDYGSVNQLTKYIFSNFKKDIALAIAPDEVQSGRQ